MFEKVSQVAEQVVTSVSRRAFLGKLSRGAVVLASTLAGLLVLPSDVQASGGKCCCGVFGGDIFDCYRRPKKQPACEAGYSPCRCTQACV